MPGGLSRGPLLLRLQVISLAYVRHQPAEEAARHRLFPTQLRARIPRQRAKKIATRSALAAIR